MIDSNDYANVSKDIFDTYKIYSEANKTLSSGSYSAQLMVDVLDDFELVIAKYWLVSPVYGVNDFTPCNGKHIFYENEIDFTGKNLKIDDICRSVSADLIRRLHAQNHIYRLLFPMVRAKDLGINEFRRIKI